MQRIMVSNKSQLLAAFECAKLCPYDTEITLIKSGTKYVIYSSDHISDCDVSIKDVMLYNDSPSIFHDCNPVAKAVASRDKSVRLINKAKAKLRKTEAKYIF